MYNLTLKGPGRTGNLLWDDAAGTFSGTDADLLTGSGEDPPSHPVFPMVSGSPRHDPKALIVLLHIWGWDVPVELAQFAAEMSAVGPTYYPPGTVF